jgi:hypothetical protein
MKNAAAAQLQKQFRSAFSARFTTFGIHKFVSTSSFDVDFEEVTLHRAMPAMSPPGIFLSPSASCASEDRTTLFTGLLIFPSRVPLPESHPYHLCCLLSNILTSGNLLACIQK